MRKVADATVSFYSYDESHEDRSGPIRGRLFCTILVHESGGFEVIEGKPPAHFIEELRSDAILAPPDGKRRVLPADGLIWAEALGISYGGPYFWAEPPVPVGLRNSLNP